MGAELEFSQQPVRRRRWRRALPHRWWHWTILGLAVLVSLVAIGSFFVDEPLRQAIERRMNQSMKGYSASIGRLSFHPVGFSLTLYDLVFLQDAKPEPPVLHVPRLDASVQWRALLHRRVVANVSFESPSVYADRRQVETEAKDPTPLDEHGWQDAFEAIYPLKINAVKIKNGRVTYVDAGPFKPLELREVNIKAENIRNVRSQEREYPSEFRVEGQVFEAGRVAVEGKADFLAEPHLGIKAAIALSGIELDYFKAITNRVNVTVRGGSLSAKGEVEYAPTIKVVDLERATIRDVMIDYTHTPEYTGLAQKATVTTVETTKQVANDPGMVLRARDVQIINSTFGLVDKTATPAYRLFLSNADLSVKNVSNHGAEGPAVVSVRGKFMGTGATDAAVSFRPTSKGPDLDVAVKVEDTEMTSMNEVLRTYGKFDVVGGLFSFYSELSVKDGYLRGYLKPLMKDVRAYDPEQDRDKTWGRRMYERLITVVSRVLKNFPRKEVVTRADIEGPVESPQTKILPVVGRAIKNAFFKAILPGFEEGSTDGSSTATQSPVDTSTRP